MKKVFILLSCVVAFTINHGNAQTITWDGGGTTNDFSEGANWVGDVAPANGQSVRFDNTNSKDCDFDGLANLNLVDITITSSYTGTIDALSTFPYLTGSFSQAGGTFISTDQDF